MNKLDKKFEELEYNLSHAYDMIQDIECIKFFMKSPSYVLSQPDGEVRSAGAMIYVCAQALQDEVFSIRETEYGIEIVRTDNVEPIF